MVDIIKAAAAWLAAPEELCSLCYPRPITLNCYVLFLTPLLKSAKTGGEIYLLLKCGADDWLSCKNGGYIDI